MTCTLALLAAYAAGIASVRVSLRVGEWWRERHSDHLDCD